MLNGDVGQPNILYRSNRCYLCFYDNNPASAAAQQMNSILGVNKTSDLIEVGGCMLRLALWPTDFLFEEVARLYQNFEDTLPFSSTKQQNRALSAIYDGASDSEVDSRQSRNLRSSSHKKKKTTDIAESSLPSPTIERNLESVPETQSKPHVNADPYFQVGLHFRCGDKSFMNRAGDQCVFKPGREADFPTGNPRDIGLCAKQVLANYTASLIRHHQSVGMYLMQCCVVVMC